MAGNFIGPQDRPGVYWNFINAAQQVATVGIRGVVAMPITLAYGPEHKFVSVSNDADALAGFGISLADPSMLSVNQALSNASEVLLYRLNVGTKATVTIGTLIATATQSGTLGNKISISVVVNPVDGTKFDVTTFLNGVAKDVQTTLTVAGLKTNAYVVFSGTANVSANAGVSLATGTDGTVANSDYTAFLSALPTEFFDVIAFPTTVSALQTSLLSTVKQLRNIEGKKIQAVAPNFAAAEQGIINVTNGVILSDGTVLDAVGATAWVAGASAGANATEDLTYKVYAGAIDANPRLSNTAVIAALKAGQFVFYFNNTIVRVEQDINSAFGQDATQFGKNKILRVLDTIQNSLTDLFATKDIGKMPNNADGQASIKTAVGLFLSELQAQGAIKNLDTVADIIIDPTKSIGDSVYVGMNVQPVDAIGKIYIDVNVS